MKTIIIKTQKELDALPDKFDEPTVIEIRSEASFWIRVKKVPDSSRVEAHGSSSVVAYDSSSVVAYDSSSVVAYDSSRVEAYGSSRVEAYGSSSVVAYDSSRVEAHGSSSVVAYDSSRVVAYDSSRVEAHGSSRVEAYGSSRVVAYDSSSVVAYDSSRVEAHGSSRVVAYDSSSVVAYDSSSVEAYDSSRVEAHGSSRVEAHGSSRVVAYDSSRVEAHGSSSVVAYGSSSVVAYQFTDVLVSSTAVILSYLADKVVCRLRGVNVKVLKKDKTVKIIKEPTSLSISFETWLTRGWVVADGLHLKLISRKKKGNIEIFTVQKDFLTDTKSYVVKRGETFSHGDTVEKAIEDLRYKLSSRDTSRFKKWTLKTSIKEVDAIQAYRAITGACEFGVKNFLANVEVPKKLTVSKVIEITKDQFGNKQFAEFFK